MQQMDFQNAKNDNSWLEIQCWLGKWQTAHVTVPYHAIELCGNTFVFYKKLL